MRRQASDRARLFQTPEDGSSQPALAFNVRLGNSVSGLALSIVGISGGYTLKFKAVIHLSRAYPPERGPAMVKVLLLSDSCVIARGTLP